MMLTSRAFAEGETIPTRYTCDGENLSPPLAWTGAPEGTASFALICDDPDAPGGKFHHWSIRDIPADRTSLGEGVGLGACLGGMHQAVNDFGGVGYGGPCPPKGDGAHRYRFRLYALTAARLDLPETADCRDVCRALHGLARAHADLIGLYAR